MYEDDPDCPRIVALVLEVFRRHGLPDAVDWTLLTADVRAILDGPYEDHQVFTATDANLLRAEQRALRTELVELRKMLAELHTLLTVGPRRTSNDRRESRTND
jgi:hypothetical protein